jgi:hypothetical protein
MAPKIFAAGTGLSLGQDGTVNFLPLYARLAKADSTTQPAVSYTTNGVTVSVSY